MIEQDRESNKIMRKRKNREKIVTRETENEKRAAMSDSSTPADRGGQTGHLSRAHSRGGAPRLSAGLDSSNGRFFQHVCRVR